MCNTKTTKQQTENNTHTHTPTLNGAQVILVTVLVTELQCLNVIYLAKFREVLLYFPQFPRNVGGGWDVLKSPFSKIDRIPG